MTLPELVKLALRLKTDAFDDEILSIIHACKVDLSIVGVKRIEDGDPIIERAVTLYAKAHFGYSENSDRLLLAYEALRNSLSLSGDYNECGGDGP